MTLKTRFLRKPQRSLRTILIVWFLLFSVAPLAFLTGFSVIRFEKAIDNELIQRLNGNAREVVSIFSDYQNSLRTSKERFINDPGFLYNMSTGDVAELKNSLKFILRGDISNTISLFNRSGRLIISSYKDENGVIKEQVPQAAIYLSDENLEKMRTTNENYFVDFAPGKKMSLILFSRIMNPNKKIVGFIEQIIDIDQSFLDAIKKRLRVEMMFLRKNGNVIVSTHADMYDYKKEYFSKYTSSEGSSFFDLNIRGTPHGFIFYPTKWSQNDLFMVIGASKSEARSILKGVNYAFFLVVGLVIVLLVVIILIISNSILKPLEDLVQATHEIQSNDLFVEIPIKSDTEIGLLTESFNEMSRNILKAKTDLKAKINELELANKEIRETQSRLVHSSKMSSLGQLVAGVAHELNNPISFIFSNMTHLRDYAEKLIRLADAAEKNPESVSQLKAEYDIEYIKSDLPKLISSCEDGARRVRDIVLGLRNFSRLEEAKLKEISIHEAIDNTLNLLSGEIKNRIQIHKYYGDIPPVTCYASQLNQVFMNILSNAVQSIKETGNIWINTKKIRHHGRDSVSISIQDSGHGIDPEIVERIFDPFFSTKGIGQGTGLGLSISYGIIQNHGGEISVKSKLGTGTEFLIIIPIKSDSKSAQVESF